MVVARQPPGEEPPPSSGKRSPAPPTPLDPDRPTRADALRRIAAEVSGRPDLGSLFRDVIDESLPAADATRLLRPSRSAVATRAEIRAKPEGEPKPSRAGRATAGHARAHSTAQWAVAPAPVGVERSRGASP